MDVCLYKAGSSSSSRFSSSPMCCCVHVWQSGINAKNIFIFYHKWTTKNQNDNFTYELSDRKSLPLFKLLALLPEPSCPASTGEVQYLFWAQKVKSWVAFSKANIALWFAPSPVCAGNSFIMGWEVKKEKEASIKCPYLLVLQSNFDVPHSKSWNETNGRSSAERAQSVWDGMCCPCTVTAHRHLRNKNHYLKTMSRFNNWTLKN